MKASKPSVLDPYAIGQTPLALPPTAPLSPAARAAGPQISLVPPAPPGLRARRLLQEGREASVEHIGQLLAAMGVVRELLDLVVEGGDVYTAGLGAFASRLSEDLFWKSKTLAALALRQRLQVETAAKAV